MDYGASSYRRFLQGDDSGLAEIILLYKDGLMFYINGYVKNLSIAQELTEDVFFKLAVKKPRFKEEYLFKTWLYTIGRNLAFNKLEKLSGHLEYPLEDFGTLADQQMLEKQCLKNERNVLLYKTMNRLKPEYREVLYLLFFEGMKNAETAKVMKKSKRQIENLAYRAKKSLRSLLEKEEFDYEGLE